MVKQRAHHSAPENFEDALAELETLVQSMEQGDLALDASLAAYQRGVSLLRYCQDRLNHAEETLQVLEDGALKPLAIASLPPGPEED